MAMAARVFQVLMASLGEWIVAGPKRESIQRTARRPRLRRLSRAFHVVESRLEELAVLLVLRGVLAVDLDPFARAGHAGGLERHHVVAGELQLRRHGRGQ